VIVRSYDIINADRSHYMTLRHTVYNSLLTIIVRADTKTQSLPYQHGLSYMQLRAAKYFFTVG